jgi:hypothetical protein
MMTAKRSIKRVIARNEVVKISSVTPAKAGVQFLALFQKKVKTWIPAFAGMTAMNLFLLSLA